MSKRIIALLTVLAAALVSTHAFAAYQAAKLDSTHSRLGFTASTLLYDVAGQFTKFDLQIEGDSQDLSKAKIKVVVDAASIKSGDAKRDEHLKNEDFLDVAKYPNIVFESDSIQQKGDKVTVQGTLSLHGKTKKLSIPFKSVAANNVYGQPSQALRAKVKLKLSEFNVGSSLAAKLSLRDELDLDLLVVVFQ